MEIVSNLALGFGDGRRNKQTYSALLVRGYDTRSTAVPGIKYASMHLHAGIFVPDTCDSQQVLQQTSSSNGDGK